MPTQTTDGSELEIVTTDAEPEKTTRTTATGAEGEKSELSLPEESDNTQVAKQSSPDEVKAKQQEDSFFKRIVDNEIDITKVPKWLQPRVQSRLDTISKSDDLHTVARQVAQEEIDKRNEDADFKRLKADLPEMSKEDAKAFTEEYKSLLKLGKVTALQKTMKMFGYDKNSQEDARMNNARSRMSLPQVGQSRAKGKESMVGGVPRSVVQNQKEWKQFVQSQGAGSYDERP